MKLGRWRASQVAVDKFRVAHQQMVQRTAPEVLKIKKKSFDFILQRRYSTFAVIQARYVPWRYGHSARRRPAVSAMIQTKARNLDKTMDT